jgi:addiction module RelE/StbE family toxin
MVDERIANAVARLIDFPESGRLGRVEDTRELVVQRIPFLIAYRITGEIVRILRVLHGAQSWPDDLPG